MVYTDDRWGYWTPGLDKVALVGTTIGSPDRLFYGHVTRVTRNEEHIDIELEDMGYRMKATYSGTYTNKTVKDAITDICNEIDFTATFDNVSSNILNKKVSSSSTMESTANSVVNSSTTTGTTSATTVCGTAYPACGTCTSDYKAYYACFQNYCPNCKKSGALNFNPKHADGGEWTCDQSKGGCDSDYCGVCGKEKISGSTASLTLVSGGISTTYNGGSGATVTANSTTTTTNTYEDEINKICTDNNLYMCIDNYEKCIIREFTGTPSSQSTIAAWMIKKDSYSYANGEIDSIKEVVVNYKNGTVTKTIGDTSDITDKNIQTYTKSDMNQTDADTFAKTALNQILREQDLEVSAEVLTSPDFRPGEWVTIPKPTDFSNTETLYISGAVVNVEGGKILNENLTLRYAPPMPDISGGSSSSANLTTLAGIAEAGAKYGYCHSCSQESCLDSAGCGDCYAMSDWLYDKLTAAGIRCHILWQSGPTNHRWIQYYNNGTWIDFPYSEYGYATNFRVTSTHSGVRVYKGG